MRYSHVVGKATCRISCRQLCRGVEAKRRRGDANGVKSATLHGASSTRGLIACKVEHGKVSRRL
jgi:hypothetical protein